MRFDFSQPVVRHYFATASRAGLLASVVLLAACATKTTIDERDSFTHDTTYSHVFAGSSETACEAGRRTLLGQGYMIDKATPNQVSGHKNYQDHENDNQHGQIQFNVNCAPSGNGRSVVYANAVRDLYSMKRSSNSASVGLSVLGSLSMPLGASDDSLVKTASETISRGAFYEGFFQQVEQNIPSAQAAINAGETPAQNPQKKAPVTTTPQSGQPKEPSTRPAAPAQTQPAPSATPSTTQPAPPATPPSSPATPATTTQPEVPTTAPPAEQPKPATTTPAGQTEPSTSTTGTESTPSTAPSSPATAPAKPSTSP